MSVDDIASRIRSRFGSQPLIRVRKSKEYSGEPLYTRDSLTGVTNRVARLFRYLMLTWRMTHEEFWDKHQEYMRDLGKLGNDITTDRGNVRKAIVHHSLSVATFEKIMRFLGWRITDMSFTLQHTRTGETKTISLNECDGRVSEIVTAQTEFEEKE